MVQNKADTTLAENSSLKAACQAAEKAEEEFREKSTIAEVSDFNWNMQSNTNRASALIFCVERFVKHGCVY